MKVYVEKKHVSIGIVTTGVIIVIMVFGKILVSSNINIKSLLALVKNAMGTLLPFIIGFGISFILESPVSWIERNIFKHEKFTYKSRRFISVLVTYILVLGTLIVFGRIIIPTVIYNATKLGEDVYVYSQWLQYDLISMYANDKEYFDNILNTINNIANTEYTIITLRNFIFTPIFTLIGSIPENINKIALYLFEIINYIFTLILAVIISFYFLMEKRYFIELTKKIIYKVFKYADNIIYFIKVSRDISRSFIVGKALDSFIVSIIFFVGCLLIGVPYALLYSVIMGITNMIPYFGPFIGAVPIVTLILLTNGYKLALIVTIFIIILQQFDGLYLGPKILGDSTGVRPIGIIFAVSIGGKLFGMLGMFLSVPIFAIIGHFFALYMNEKNE